MISLIDYEAALHLWGIDKFDFFVCISAYVGVVFGSVETGLVIAVFDRKKLGYEFLLEIMAYFHTN